MLRPDVAGFALIAALIALVVMTLAAIALVRSVDTTNLIAGNMAFQQSTASSSDLAVTSAVNWISGNTASTVLQNDSVSNGYFATDPCPANPTLCADWVGYLNSLQANGQMVTLAADGAGNVASYVIQRLCSSTGDPLLPATGCSTSVNQNTVAGNSQSAGSAQYLGSTQIYYRISVRMVGPRNTVSYIQTIVMI